MHVLESVKKYDEVVNLCQRQLKDPRVSEEKHCQSQVQEGCL